MANLNRYLGTSSRTTIIGDCIEHWVVAGLDSEALPPESQGITQEQKGVGRQAGPNKNLIRDVIPHEIELREELMILYDDDAKHWISRPIQNEILNALESQGPQPRGSS